MRVEHYDQLIPVTIFEVDGAELSTSWRAGVTIGDDVRASIKFLVQFLTLWFTNGGPLRGKAAFAGMWIGCIPLATQLAQAVNDVLPSRALGTLPENRERVNVGLSVSPVRASELLRGAVPNGLKRRRERRCRWIIPVVDDGPSKPSYRLLKT